MKRRLGSKSSKVDDATVRKLFKQFDKKYGFLVLGEHYVFMGLCPDCRRKEGDSLGRFNMYPKFRHGQPQGLNPQKE